MTTSGAAAGQPDHAAPETQADVIAFLSSGGPGEPEPERIDTHIATVFLTHDRAWKLKRAVRFGYLDFLTPAKRKAMLEKELYLNRRTAPELYIGVHPISRGADGQLAIGGEGTVVDWVLEMRRFPDGALLSERAGTGPLAPAMLMRLADRIHAFHSQAQIIRSDQATAAWRDMIEGNIESMTAFPDILDPAAVAALADRHRSLSDQLSPLLAARAHAGRVRHAHGDLHLGNIALIENEPVLFDCLEFSPELATVDILYDLSFLLMDLWQRGLRNEANIVFNRYLDRSPADENALRLMPLFLSVRAAIRAHVLAAQSQRAGGDAQLVERACAYLDVAADFLTPVPPRLVAIGGLSGTGKSTLARALAHMVGRPPGARILRSDVLRKRMAEVSPETRLPVERYTRAASQEVYRMLQTMAGSALMQGQAVVADAVFADKAERTAMEVVANAADLPFDGLWLVAAETERASRIAARPADASDADVALVSIQSAYDIGDLGRWHRLPADGDLSGTVATALSFLEIR